MRSAVRSGQERSIGPGTVDIDIVLRWNLTSLQAAERALAAVGLVSRLPVHADDVFQFRDEYVRNRNLIAWNFYNPQDRTGQVDIVITYDLKGKRRRRVETADGPVHILSRRDLIAMKRTSGRPQDLEDADARYQRQIKRLMKAWVLEPLDPHGGPIVFSQEADRAEPLATAATRAGAP